MLKLFTVISVSETIVSPVQIYEREKITPPQISVSEFFSSIHLSCK